MLCYDLDRITICTNNVKLTPLKLNITHNNTSRVVTINILSLAYMIYTSV